MEATAEAEEPVPEPSYAGTSFPDTHVYRPIGSYSHQKLILAFLESKGGAQFPGQLIQVNLPHVVNKEHTVGTPTFMGVA